MRTLKIPATAIFLAHEQTSGGYSELLVRLVRSGCSIIASDAVAISLSKTVSSVSGFKRYRKDQTIEGLGLPTLPMPETLVIGMTYPIADGKIADRLVQHGIPCIDLIVIDPAKAQEMRMTLSAAKKPTPQMILDAIAPNLAATITATIKSKRLVVSTEEDLRRVIDAIESGMFTSEEQVDEVAALITICNANSWKLLYDGFTVVNDTLQDKVQAAKKVLSMVIA